MSAPTINPLIRPDAAPKGLEYKTAMLAPPQVGTDANTTVDPDTHEVTAVVAVTGVRDAVGDVIVPGAFERSLGERPKPKVCMGHDWNRPIGKTLTINEYRPGDPNLPRQTYDGKPWPKQAGALIARYTPDLSTEDGSNAFNSAKFFGTDESTFSIGYKTQRAKHANNTRFLHDVDLYEYGPVLVPANRLAALLDIKNNAEGIERTSLEPDETKAKQVRDVAYWGEPYGTPITGDMHPHGPKARAVRRDGGVPSRSVGVMAPGEAKPEAPKITARQRGAEAPQGLLPEPASDARVLPHPTKAKGNDQAHIDNLAHQVAYGGTSPDAEDDERAEADKAMHGLLNEAITPGEVSQRLAAHPTLSAGDRQGDESAPSPHADDIADAVRQYTARYQALAAAQHSSPTAQPPGAQHYANMSNAQVATDGDAARTLAAGMHDNGISTSHPAYQQARAHAQGADEELARRDAVAAAHPSVDRAHEQGLAYRAANPDMADRRANDLATNLVGTRAGNQANPPEHGSQQEVLPHQIEAMMQGLRGQDRQGNTLPEAPKAPAGPATARIGVPTGAPGAPKPPTSAGEAVRTGIPTGNADRDASALTMMNNERGHAMISNMSDQALGSVDKELAGRASALGKPGQLTRAHQSVRNEIDRRAALTAPKVEKPKVGSTIEKTRTEVSTGAKTLPYTVISRDGKRQATVEYQGHQYGIEHHGGALGHVEVTDPLGNKTRESGGSTLELRTNRAASREMAVRTALSKAHEGYTSRLAQEGSASEADLAKRHANTLPGLSKAEQGGRAARFSSDMLGALDKEMGDRATALGKPGQVSPSHKIIKDEIGRRASLSNEHDAAQRAERDGNIVTAEGAPSSGAEARRGATEGTVLGGSLISPAELDEFTKTGDETHGLTEHPDGSLEVEKDVADRQDRVQGLLGDHAAGKFDLSKKSTDDLHTHHADLTAELSLQNQIARHDTANPPKPKTPAAPKVAAEGPKVRPGLAGAAQDHAEALRSGDEQAIIRTRGRLDSSLRRSRASSDTARTLADHVGSGAADAGKLDSLATSLKTESRTKRNAAAQSRRTAKRLDRDRIKSVLGSVDTELRSRGEAPEVRAEPGAPVFTDRIVDGRPGKGVPRLKGSQVKPGDVIAMAPAGSSGSREWAVVHHSKTEQYMGARQTRFFDEDESHSALLGGGEYVQHHSSPDDRRIGEAGAAAAQRATGDVAAKKPDDAIGTPKVTETTPKTPVTPLTDEEYAKHTKMVEDTLNREIKAGHATDVTQTVRGEGKIYSGNRARMHSDIVNALWEKNGANVPTEGKSVIAGGLGGAGKSTVLKGHAGIEGSHYLTINPDDIKEEFAKRGMIPEVKGLSPMESSALVHEESSHVANMLAKRAYENKTNVMWDITMSSKGSVDKRISEMAKHGYSKPDAVFVDIPVETSVSRALGRHRRGMEKFRNGEGVGGRYVPPNIIRKNSSSTSSSANRDVFNSLRDKFGSHVVYDNSVVGREPQKITGNGRWGVGSSGLENFHPGDTPEERTSKLTAHYKFLDENGVSGPYRNPAPVQTSLESVGAPTFIGGDDATPELKAAAAQMLAPHIGPHATTPKLAIRNLDNEKGSNDLAKKGGVAAQYWHRSQLIEVSPQTLGITGEFKNKAGFFSNSGDANFAQRSVSHEYGHHLDYELEKSAPSTHAKMMDEVLGALGRRSSSARVVPAGEIRGNTHIDHSPTGWLAKNKAKIVNRVSTYGATNRREMMAELYAEYKHAATPSKAATIAGDYLTGRKK